MAKNEKSSKWVFIAYPDSVPDNWRDILTESGLEIAISPLHDMDTNPTGERKKPHWHIIAVWQGPTTYKVAQSLAESINGTVPKVCMSVKGNYRYLTHMDNPEKYQYDVADITHLNGFNIRDYSDLHKGEVTRIKYELQQLIRENNLCEYSDFMDIVQDMDNFDYYDVACNNTVFFNAYLKSKKWRDRPEPYQQ